MKLLNIAPIIYLIATLLTSSVYAKKRFFSVEVRSKRSGTLKEAILSSTSFPEDVFKKPGFLKMIKRYNPKLRLKSKVKKGQKIYIELPYKTAMHYARLEKKAPPKQEFIENRKRGLSFSYSLSRKTIEDTSDSVSVDSLQNSPYTFGISYNKKFSDQYSYFGTFYFSSMNDSTAPNGQPVEVPLEMALKSYYQKLLSNGFMIYGGFDIERFSTFKALSVTEVARLQHSFAFLTAGFARPFSLFGKKMLFKLSFAQSVWNKLDLQAAVPTEFETFSGQKVASLLIFSLSPRYGLHLFYDKHVLEAESKLDINRFGGGAHFRF